MNPLQFMQLFNKNPQQVLQQALGNNPMTNNLIQMIQNNDKDGIEQLARNLAKEKGQDADKLYNQFKTQLGL